VGLGPTDSAGFGPAKGATPSQEEAMAREERTAIYRECIENVKPEKLLALEAMFRDKLNTYAAGAKTGSKGYDVKNTFRYLDRDANGCVDLENLCQSLEFMGIETANETMTVALFARYDVQRRGFVDYQEFVKYILGNDYFGRNETAFVAKKIESLAGYFKRNGNFQGLAPASPGRFRLSKSQSIHALTDEEFMERQRIRAIFDKLDIDNSGYLDRNEYERMLRHLGCVLNVKASDAIFQQIDSDGSGEISFDEFFAFYHMEIPEEMATSGK